MHEALIADDDALQTEQLIKIKRDLAGLADRAAPALDAILGWVLALDG
jgi:hypothetical protein